MNPRETQICPTIKCIFFDSKSYQSETFFIYSPELFKERFRIFSRVKVQNENFLTYILIVDLTLEWGTVK